MEPRAFIHPAQILKADADGHRIRILIKASSEAEDRDGEVILKTALSEPRMRASFAREGYYDYNHLTDLLDAKMRGAVGPELVDLQKAKAEAIIGFPDPTNALFTKDDGVYSEGFLFGENRFVQEITKGLRAGWDGWAASISGFALPSGVEGRTIKSMTLRKIAIAPRAEAINPETSVTLLKSDVCYLRDIYKSQSAETLPPLADSPQSARLAGLERKLDLVLGHLHRSTEFLDHVALDVQKALGARTLEAEPGAVARYLTDAFAFPAPEAQRAAGRLLNTLTR